MLRSKLADGIVPTHGDKWGQLLKVVGLIEATFQLLPAQQELGLESFISGCRPQPERLCNSVSRPLAKLWYLDLLPIHKKAAAAGLLYLPFDARLNAGGHRVTA